MADLPPTLPGAPLLGSLVDLRRDSLATHLRALRECGEVVRIVVGPPGWRTTFYGVFSAEGARQVLTTESSNFRKDSKAYGEIRATFGDGLLTSQDETYRRQRRLIQPLFTRRRVDQYADAIAEEVDGVLRHWRQRDDPIVELHGEMTRLTLRVVARILFGTDAEEAVPTVRRCFPVISEGVLQRVISPINPPRSWPTRANRRRDAAQKELYALCDRIIAERAAAGRRDDATSDDLLGLFTLTRDSSGDQFAASEVRDQVLIFLLAGHETTATALTFALHLLALHPDAQAKARAEVDDLLDGRTPVAADVDNLPYVTCVIKEAMRLYPSAPAISRMAVADTEIAGFRIPARSNVFVSTWAIHRNPAYWPDPERFDPDRFHPDAEENRPRYAWMPFGGGPRACIGQHMSMLESTLSLAMVLQAFELAPVDTAVSVRQGITLRATSRVRCRLTPRRQP